MIMKKIIGLKNGFALILLLIVQFSFSQDNCSSVGWANLDGQNYVGPITGGGNASITQVTTFAQLKSALESSDAKVIHVMNDVGNGYKGTSGDVLNVKSNKTVIGVKPGITVKCSWQIKNCSNVIVRNLICRGPGNSNSEQNWDCVNIQGAKRIWFDHCTVMEGEDGNFDVVKGSDNVTVTWCKFYYVTGGGHNLSNLIGSSNNESQSHGKLNVTYAYCWWDNVNSRYPRTRYGKIHVLNCYYNNVGSGAYAGKMSNIRVEGSYFEDNVKNPTGLISTDGEAGVFIIDCNRGSTKTDGYNTPFTPPYEYDKFDVSEVKAKITDPNCGAGPTLDNPTDCGCSTGAPNGISVALTTPDNNSSFELPSPIDISANASDDNGSISTVEFYINDQLIDTDQNSPYNTSWTPTTTGSFTITAKATDNDGNTKSSNSRIISINVPQAPYNGTAHLIPGTIQLEEFDLGGNGSAYKDDSPGSETGSSFRDDEDVDIEACSDVDGGYNIGWATAGEWLEYTVNVGNTGIYTLELRVACDGDGRTIDLQIGDVLINDIAIPNTGGWQNWETIIVPNVALTAGEQIMKLTVGDVSYVNLNYMTVKGVVTATSEEIQSIDRKSVV